MSRLIPLMAVAALAVAGWACKPETATTPAPASTEKAGKAGKTGRAARPQTLETLQTRQDRAFGRLDADNNGVITAGEFDLANRNGSRGARGLKRADTDGDGRVTQEEARAMVARRFARLDKNGDGQIGADERPTGGRRAAAKAATNPDDADDAALLDETP